MVQQVKFFICWNYSFSRIYLLDYDLKSNIFECMSLSVHNIRNAFYKLFLDHALYSVILTLFILKLCTCKELQYGVAAKFGNDILCEGDTIFEPIFFFLSYHRSFSSCRCVKLLAELRTKRVN